MRRSIVPYQFVASIRSLAASAVAKLPLSSAAAREAKIRVRRPVDYMRCAEFPLAFDQLMLKPGMRILDVSSPQWFSLCLAKTFPQTTFFYVNVVEHEIALIEETAKRLDMDNISYYRDDVRKLRFDTGYFDAAMSISVIEHVAPENGGDETALGELRRVLKPGGRLTLSVPLKERRGVVYQNGEVYERPAMEKNFFAREYDVDQFNGLAAKTGFIVTKRSFIVERPGILALDYWQWGPGRGRLAGRLLVGLVQAVELLFGRSIEDRLAARYLAVSDSIAVRCVNIVATLTSRNAPAPL